MNLTTLFDGSFHGRRERPALEHADTAGVIHTLTFGEVDERASRMAQELAARGLERGDRLCVHLANRVEFIDLFLACARLGVVMVPMNVLYRERELRHIVSDSEPAAVVSSQDSDAVYPPGTPVWFVEALAECASTREARRPAVTIEGGDPALIIYTSGTTGAAKGAVLSHDNLAANGRTLVAAWRVTDRDRYLAVLPLFLVWLYYSWLVILLGAELTVSASFWHNHLWKKPPRPAMRLAEALAVAQALGETEEALAFTQLQERTKLPAEELEEALRQMSEAHFVKQAKRDAYSLTAAARRPIEQVLGGEVSPTKRRRRRNGRSSR